MSETVTPYNSSEEKKKQVSNMFDNISGYYDFLNHFLSLGIDKRWRKKAIGYLKDIKPTTVLDVATGTGDLAIEAHKQLKPVKVTGVDISTKMLEKGRVKLKKRKLSEDIQLFEGDSENLNFEDNTFDAVTVAFGVRNYQNLQKGILEMRRVLRPGGRLVVLEFSRPKLFPFKQLFNIYFKYILPLIGRLTSKDKRAYSYLYESVQAFPDGNKFLEVLQQSGYKNCTCKSLTLGICSVYTADK